MAQEVTLSSCLVISTAVPDVDAFGLHLLLPGNRKRAYCVAVDKGTRESLKRVMVDYGVKNLSEAARCALRNSRRAYGANTVSLLL